MDKKVSQQFYEKELTTLKPRKFNLYFIVSLIISLLFFSWIGYLILTEEPPVSEKSFFESIGFEYDSTSF